MVKKEKKVKKKHTVMDDSVMPILPPDATTEPTETDHHVNGRNDDAPYANFVNPTEKPGKNQEISSFA
jgi:hypothetical protein